MSTSFHKSVFSHFLRNSPESIRINLSTKQTTIFLSIFHQLFSEMRKSCVKSMESRNITSFLHRENEKKTNGLANPIPFYSDLLTLLYLGSNL